MNFQQQLSRLIFAGSIEAWIPPVFSNHAHCSTFDAYSPHCQKGDIGGKPTLVERQVIVPHLCTDIWNQSKCDR